VQDLGVGRVMKSSAGEVDECEGLGVEEGEEDAVDGGQGFVGGEDEAVEEGEGG